jgi:hypothetical protein
VIGEHIRALKDGRWVHAIDCGDDTVLHLAEEPAPRRVRRAYRPEFLSGATSVETVTHRERTFPPREVVRRAYSRASVPALAAMFGDSEAFAAWCTTGRTPAPLHVPAAPVADPAPAPAGDATPAPARAKRGRAAPARAAKGAKRQARTVAKRKRPAKRGRATRSGSSGARPKRRRGSSRRPR